MKDESLPHPPSDHGQSRDEIAAEIADHLAASEAELVKKGSAQNDARTLALKKFGDIEKIQKTCYWIQNGEAIMLRWSLVSLAAVLCVLLGLSVLSNWRTQSQLAEQVGKLSEELKAMAAAKQAPPPVPLPPEITGVIYAGSKDKPKEGASVAILRADGSVVRRTTCDEMGVYHSGPLEPGDYCVTSPVLDAPPSFAGWVTQSEPLFLHGASGKFSCSLDAAYHSGAIRIVANRELPELRKDGSYRIKSRLSVAVVPSRYRNALWTPSQDTPVAWPVYCHPTVADATQSNAFSLRGSLGPWTTTLELNQVKSAEIREGKEIARYPVGKTEFVVMLSLTVVPTDENGDAVLLGQRVFGTANLLQSLPAEKRRLRPSDGKFLSVPWPSLDSNWREISGGNLWIEHLKHAHVYPNDLASPKPPSLETLEIREDQVTTLQIEIPEGVELEVQKAVDATPDYKQFVELVRQGLLQRPLKIVKTSYEPMGK